MPLTVSRVVIVVTEYSYNRQWIRIFCVCVCFTCHFHKPLIFIQHVRPPLGLDILQVRYAWCVMVARLTTQVWSSPFNAHPGFITSFGIGSHSGAETLTVPTCVTCTWVFYARSKVRTRINLKYTKKDTLCERLTYRWRYNDIYITIKCQKLSCIYFTNSVYCLACLCISMSACFLWLHLPYDGRLGRWHWW